MAIGVLSLLLTGFAGIRARVRWRELRDAQHERWSRALLVAEALLLSVTAAMLFVVGVVAITASG